MMCIPMPLRVRTNPKRLNFQYVMCGPPRPSEQSMTKYSEHYDRLDRVNSEMILKKLGLLSVKGCPPRPNPCEESMTKYSEHYDLLKKLGLGSRKV
jgi:hypothetical protein